MREADGRDWDAIVLAMPRPHVLQSRVWGDLKGRWGWRVHRLAWGHPGSESAVAQVLVKRLGKLPMAVGYAPRGPVLRQPADPDSWDRVLADLECWSVRKGLAWLKMDPAVAADCDAVLDVWRARGWQRSDEQVQFENTMVSDLTVGRDALLASMKPKTRYNLRLAGRRGVTARRGGRGDLSTFWGLYRATARRDGFAIRARDYYIDAWSRQLAADRAVVVLAERDGVALAGAIPVAFGATAWFLYGASADTGREHMASYLVQWEALRWAMERGCTTYDWWGAPSVLSASDRLWGVYRFKSGFGARLVREAGAWDYRASPARDRVYRVLRAGRRMVSSAMRRGGALRRTGWGRDTTSLH